jgi:hypothetical protein
MSDGYEVFDTGHDHWEPMRRQLSAEECHRVVETLQRLPLVDDEDALLMLRHATGRRIVSIEDLYDVELPRVLDYLRKASSTR